jgi:hypothetical protein
MTSKNNVSWTMVALAMFALPASAIAGHHHNCENLPRPYAWHDQGWHRGWLKHHGQSALRPVEDEDDEDADEYRHCRSRY